MKASAKNIMNNKKRKKLTVIIPVYNVEKYIVRCVNSVVTQTYKDLEIILVDDGSTDNSGSICDEYAKRDERVKVIHKHNGGLSSARNEGMKYATGELVAFVDSDDYIEPTMYQTMIELLEETDSDMAICNICFVDEDGNELTGFEHINLLDDKPYFCVEKNDIMMQLRERDLLTVVQWNKVFYRDKIKDCQYPEGRYHEDVYVIHKQLYNCDRIVYVNNKFYNYVQRNNSIMHTETDKMIMDAIEGYESRVNFFSHKKMEEAKQIAISDLLKYIRWKIEEQSVKGVPINDIWLIEVFREKIEKYRSIDKYNQEEMSLYKNPLKYCRNIIKKRKAKKNRKKYVMLICKLKNIFIKK